MLRNLGKSSINFKRTFMSGKVALEKPVLYNVQDTARVVTLNRSNKLNALNTEMCDSIFSTLNEYSKSGCTNIVVLKSANQPRSFCAGGDVATVALQNVHGNIPESIKFFTSEYSLNFQLATFSKPIVAIMDGITMGGGVGLAIHTPFRIATENTKWAMPEMDIGFFPDVGTTFALPRIITIANNNAEMALYLTLTGDVISGKDAYMLGLASHYIEHERLEDLQARLGELKSFVGLSDDSESFFNVVNNAIEEFTSPLPRDYKFKFSNDQLNVIERCFNVKKISSIKTVFHNLDETITNSASSKETIKFANEIKSKLLQKSPTSLQVAVRLLQENSTDNIEGALKRDLYTATNFCVSYTKDSDSKVEFSEATIHKLVEKHKAPYDWKHTLEDLAPSQITSLVSPKPSLPVSLIKNYANVTWKQYPYHLKFQLPIEKRIMRKITSTDGSVAMTKKDLVAYFTSFDSSTKGKVGVEQLCNIVIDRKCSTDDSNNLTWNHS